MQTVKIANETLSVKEYEHRRVVTHHDVDMVHNRPRDTARKAFRRNFKHFVLGVDYFVLKRDEAHKCFGMVAPNGLILLTESGYLMLVKSFTDDLAWKVQRELVNCYFKTEPEQIAVQTEIDLPSKPMRRLVVDIPHNKEAQQKMNEIRDTATALKIVLENFNRYIQPKEVDKYTAVIADLGDKTVAACGSLGRLRLSTIEEPR